MIQLVESIFQVTLFWAGVILLALIYTIILGSPSNVLPLIFIAFLSFQLVSTAVISSSSHLFDNAKGEEKEEEEKERQKFVAAAVEYIVTAISDGLKGFDPLRQAEGDECVR